MVQTNNRIKAKISFIERYNYEIEEMLSRCQEVENKGGVHRKVNQEQISVVESGVLNGKFIKIHSQYVHLGQKKMMEVLRKKKITFKEKDI
jgi:hypothetical protein